MVNNLEDILSGGFHTWSRNINIAVPLIINELIQLFILIFSLAIGMLMLLGVNSAEEITLMSEEELASLLMSASMDKLPALVIFTILVFGILLLIDSYFTAGAIGMGQNATSIGDTSISDMLASGGKNFINVFLANVLLILIKFVGVIFVVPGAFIVRNNMEMMAANELTAGILLLVVGFGIWMIYLLILDIIFKPVLYIIVIEKMDAVDGILQGFRFFMENKLSIFFIWLFIFLISIIVNIIFYFISYIISFARIEQLDFAWSFGSQLLIILTLQPLIIIWWTRLYMVRTGKSIYTNDLLTDSWDA
jgi:hypothetical protein